MTAEERFAAKEKSQPVFVNSNPEHRHELNQW
jgi:hypothetical protein